MEKLGWRDRRISPDSGSLFQTFPNGNLNLSVEAMESARGIRLETAPGSSHTVYLAIPEGIDLSYGLLMRNLEAGTTTRNPQFR
ncbi:hypothetical protein [Pseudomonas sp. HPB0071]|uniref:hypothetical protein n=1 Tax=Pseudomonas sp. HPB0071 TaxID=1203578 RepID=UPI0003F680CC|nr:hypothetical protein [Pseudomonas sp. HPB0071]